MIFEKSDILGLIDEIIENGRELNLKMDAENVVEFINSPDSELNIEYFIELKEKTTMEETDENFEA